MADRFLDVAWDGRTKLSMAGLETLAIIAYRQPITAPEIAELRGVTSASSVRTLLDKKLITTAGRKPVVGTPFLYKTTKEFLVHFGLSDLSELPKPEELEALYGIEAGGPDPAQTELFPVRASRRAAEAAASAPAPGRLSGGSRCRLSASRSCSRRPASPPGVRPRGSSSKGASR